MKACEVKLVYKTKIKPSDRFKVTSSNDANEVLRKFIDVDQLELRESFYILLMNASNRVLGVTPISAGNVSACLVDVKLIAQTALLANSSAVILAHNHPSGELKPSLADEKITKKVKEALSLFDISVLDHLILTSESYLSMSDEGII